MPFPRKITLTNAGETPSLLLVGSFGEHLQEIAMGVLKEAEERQQHIIVYTSDKLPVDGSGVNDIVQISLVVFFIDVCDKESLARAKLSLTFLPVEFYLGRLLFVGLNFSDESQWSISPEEVSILSKECDCPVLWGSLDKVSGKAVFMSQILTKLKLLSSDIPYISPTTMCGNSRDYSTEHG
ncbi:centromere protein M-like [Clavelina lepadiformis]|uniref:centromere protein M-like n=1 Tax=Clavelina lepadiformis TaxID=159417 RepID=UPI0040433DC1